MNIYKTFFVVFIVAVLSSCTARTAQEKTSTESIYTPAHIQKLGATDYEAAMRLTNEGMRKGQISAFTANQLRANLTYQYTEDNIAAADWLRKALEQEEAQEPGTRTQLLYHLATILKNAKDYTACLSTCTEGKEVAQSAGLNYEKNAFDFLAGSCLFDLGDDDAGLKIMTDAIAGASAVVGSEEEYGHLIYFIGSLINSYLEVEDYNSALEQCALYERLLSVMTKDYPDVPEEYLGRMRFYLDIDRAICYAKTGETALASEAFNRARENSYAESDDGKARLVNFYAAIGDPGSILKIYNEDLPYTDSDTVSRIYRRRLARMREAFRNAGMIKEAADMDARYEALSELIEEKERAEGIGVKVAEYNAQRYRFYLSDTLSTFRKYRWSITVLIVLIAVSFGVFILLNHRLNRRKEARHRKVAEAQEKDIRELRKQVSIIAERELYSDKPLNGNKKDVTLPKLIEKNKLYLNKNLNRYSAAALLGISQAELTRMLGEIEPGLSFPDYIKSLRIRHALQLLGENPDISIAELSDRCGFYTIRTLQRSFLAVTGQSPSEYAKNLKKQTLGRIHHQ